MNMKGLLGIVLTLGLAIAAPAALANDDAPTAIVRGATDALLAQIRDHRADFQRDRDAFHRAIDATIAPAFDLAYTAQLVLGRSWKSATPEQRARFQAAFSTLLITQYGDALLDRPNLGAIQWLPSSIDGDAATARANLPGDAGAPLALGFALRLGADGRWRVYDVTLESVSLVTNFRGQFSAEVRSAGIDGLIQRLEASPALAGRVAQAK
jgi:phospholipid transport system substrate-binding protein